MKYRLWILIILSTTLSSCSLSFTRDVTPPPDFATPTVAPEIIIVQPEVSPSPQRGSVLYSNLCAPCHGDRGFGNGPLAGDMPVAVKAIGLPDVYRRYSPAEWYVTILSGNPDRGMPSFLHLDPQNIWDILAFISTVNIPEIYLTNGGNYFSTHCVDCHGVEGNKIPSIELSNHEVISQYSEISLYQSIVEGKGEMKPFLEILSDEEIWEVVYYLRSLSLDYSDLDTSIEANTPTSTDSSRPTPSDETTSTQKPDTTIAAEQTSFEITGSVENGSGIPLIGNPSATLVIYNPTMEEVVETDTSTIDESGYFTFTNLSIDNSLAYWVSVEYQSVTYYSEYNIFDGLADSINLPVIVYESTSDWSNLVFDLVQISMDYSNDLLSIGELFVISNPGTATVIIETDGTALPFITKIDEISGYPVLSPDSRGSSFLPANNGIALPPSLENQYGIIASYTAPYDKRWEFKQEFPIQISSISLFVPEGMKIKTEQLELSGTQDISGDTYQIYSSTNYLPGILNISISDLPGDSRLRELDKNGWLILGSGGLGVVFISLGVILFLRDRTRIRDEEVDDVESSYIPSPDETVGSMLDAVVILDEQLANGDITNKAYAKQRRELITRIKAFHGK